MIDSRYYRSSLLWGLLYQNTMGSRGNMYIGCNYGLKMWQTKVRSTNQEFEQLSFPLWKQECLISCSTPGHLAFGLLTRTVGVPVGPNGTDVATFSHKRSAWIKKLFLQKFSGAPKNLRVDTFPDPVSNFEAPWRPFLILKVVRHFRRWVSAPLFLLSLIIGQIVLVLTFFGPQMFWGTTFFWTNNYFCWT